MNDSELDDLLRSATCHGRLPETFRHGVWSRIEGLSLESGRAFGWLEDLFAVLSRPAGTAIAVASMVIFGLGIGAMSLPGSADFKVEYVKSISPFAGAHGE